MGTRFRNEWDRLARATGFDKASAAALGDELEQRHAEPHRSYHTAAHIEAVIDRFKLGADFGCVMRVKMPRPNQLWQ